MKVNAAIKGVKELAEKLGKSQKQTLQAIGAGLYAVGHEVRRVALPITPLDLGNLRATIYVTPPEITVGKVHVEVGVGGTSAPYALIVHEAPEWWNWQEPGTGPKFLEKAMNKVAKRAGQIISKTAIAHLQKRSFFTGKFSKGGVAGFKKGATDWLKNAQTKKLTAAKNAKKSLSSDLKKLMKPKQKPAKKGKK